VERKRRPGIDFLRVVWYIGIKSKAEIFRRERMIIFLVEGANESTIPLQNILT